LAKVVLIALSAVFPAALGALEGVKGILRSQLDVARVFQLSRRQTLFKLVLPAAAPQILTGLHLSLIYAWLATVGGEYLLQGPGAGIGSAVIRGQAGFRVDLIIFGMLLIGGVGALLNRLALRAEQRLLHWRCCGTPEAY
jgi:sulfonate transport system permease protein